ncbi:MAG: GNAT family N-acetyltransferase [Hyphomicrobiaceae bacterium]
MTDEQTGAIEIRPTMVSDLAAVSALHANVFGPGRFARTAYRVRENARKVSPFCRVARRDGRFIATVSFTPLIIDNQRGVLMLGPVAVDRNHANQGYGRQLIADGLAAAAAAGVHAIVLVGDLDYFGRLGFQVVPPGQLIFPGPVDPSRILASELIDGALENFRGQITADCGEQALPQ